MSKLLQNLTARINNLIQYKDKKKPVDAIPEEALFSDEEIDLFGNFWIQNSFEEEEFKTDSNIKKFFDNKK
jgi:hypothetical protein